MADLKVAMAVIYFSHAFLDEGEEELKTAL